MLTTMVVGKTKGAVYKIITSWRRTARSLSASRGTRLCSHNVAFAHSLPHSGIIYACLLSSRYKITLIFRYMEDIGLRLMGKFYNIPGTKTSDRFK